MLVKQKVEGLTLELNVKQIKRITYDIEMKLL